MTPSGCPHESAVARAARSGQWADSLTAHLEGCVACRQVAQAAGWMKRLNDTAPQARSLPDPGLVWLKAKLLEDQAAAERALRPVAFAESAAQGVVAVFAAFWLTWNWPKIQAFLTGLIAQPSKLSWLPDPAAAGSALYPWQLTFVSLAVAAFCLVVVFAIHPIIARE